jgi:hypothetical protein
MRKYAFCLSALLGIILFACGGGGGGGGGGGTGNSDSQATYSLDYMTYNPSKVYSFQETEDDGSGDPRVTDVTYSYQQVDSIPTKYGYSGTIAGPYTLETISTDGGNNTVIYMDSAETIISDDSSFFTSIDSSTSTGGSLPPDMVINKTYSFSSTEDLFNSDPISDTWALGEKIGSKKTDWSTRVVGVENVTVPAGTFEALKTADASTVTYTFDNGATQTTTSSGNTWFGKGTGTVKKVSSNSTVISDGTSSTTTTSTVTDELTAIE